MYALYSCADPIRGLCIYLTWEATNLMALPWEVRQQCTVRPFQAGRCTARGAAAGTALGSASKEREMP